MTVKQDRGKTAARVVLAALALAVAVGAWGAARGVPDGAGKPRTPDCEKIVLAGEVSAGRAWQAALGQGWVFRLLPIRADEAGEKKGASRFSGWDLVVDREPPAGYPDALLLATPPYDSIGEREVGTTYGLRAQDAIGWNPRSFRFMTDPVAFREAQRLYLSLSRAGWPRPAPTGGNLSAEDRSAEKRRELQQLMKLTGESSPGEFRILDARLTPGTGDAAPYAENWALRSRNTPQTDVPAPGGISTPRGEIEWIRFSVTLWLPYEWSAPRDLHAVRTGCSE